MGIQCQKQRISAIQKIIESEQIIHEEKDLLMKIDVFKIDQTISNYSNIANEQESSLKI
ncbi:MAG: hypothetical protein LEGION0398_MBIBDBAK_00567 [Legionellaceae bacterium]